MQYEYCNKNKQINVKYSQFFWIRYLLKFDQNVQSQYQICSKIYGSFLRHNCKNKIYLEGLRNCTSLKVFRHLLYYSAINYWTEYIFLCIQIQIFKTCIYKFIDRQQFIFIFQCKSYYEVRENIYFTLVPFDYDRNA